MTYSQNWVGMWEILKMVKPFFFFQRWKKVLVKYTEIWSKIKNLIGRKKFMIKSYDNNMITNSHGKVPKERVEWRCGVAVITTAQLHSTKPELRFCTRSNSAQSMFGDSRWWGSLTMVSTRNKGKGVLSVIIIMSVCNSYWFCFQTG